VFRSLYVHTTRISSISNEEQLNYSTVNCIQNITDLQAGYFDHADQLGTSISIYHINLIDFEQRIKKLVLSVFMCKISNARAKFIVA
jgi:hypothetical protein